MKQRMKTLPFDIVRAKRIQAGEEPGEIVTKNGHAVRIICWDREWNYYRIVVLVMVEDMEYVEYYTLKGECRRDKDSLEDLVLRVPCTDKFEPFQHVLVRNAEDECWDIDIYGRRNGDFYLCMTGNWNYCIPYNEGTKHLLGTTDNWEG